MNPFLEPTVARPLPAGTGLAGHCRPADNANGPSAGTKPPVENKRRRVNRHGPTPRRQPKATPGASRYAALLAAALLGVAGLVLPTSVSAVDVNQASEPELRTIKGIGPKTAQNILDERQRGGPYASLVDLSERVKGIGPKKLAALKAAGLMVGAASASAEETRAASRPGSDK